MTPLLISLLAQIPGPLPAVLARLGSTPGFTGTCVVFGFGLAWEIVKGGLRKMDHGLTWPEKRRGK